MVAIPSTCWHLELWPVLRQLGCFKLKSDGSAETLPSELVARKGSLAGVLNSYGVPSLTARKSRSIAETALSCRCHRLLYAENTVSGYILQCLNDAARPANLYCLCNGAASEPEVGPWIT
jgi:hypothetical protein